MRSSREEDLFQALLQGLEQESPREVAKLAALARALEHARPVGGPGASPSSAFRDSLRNRLLAEAALRRPWLERVRGSLAERNVRLRRSFRFVVANAAAAAVLLAGGSVFAVADRTVPGDLLWKAKRLHEDARLLVTRAPEPRAYLQLELARERLDEVRELVGRHQQAASPYFTALNDMDARTLDATRLLVEAYGRTRDRLGLDRLTQFAVAQRLGLEVLVEQMPPAARPPARDSIDILERVTQRVTGIVGGCLCPANPLVPQSGPIPSDPAAGGSGSGSQAPLCPCSDFRGDDRAGDGDGSTPGDGNGEPGPLPPAEEPPPEDQGLLPDLPNTSVDDTVTDVVNDLIDGALDAVTDTVEQVPLPVPAPSLPAVPKL